MTPRGKEAATLALHRFGLGPGFGSASAGYSIAAIAGDSPGALLAELERPKSTFLVAELPSSAQAARAAFDFRA